MSRIMIVSSLDYIDHGTIIKVCRSIHEAGVLACCSETEPALDYLPELSNAILRFYPHDEVDISYLFALSVRTDLHPVVDTLYKPIPRRRAWLNDYG